jgi:hypothetical protein
MCDEPLQRDDFTVEELFEVMVKRLDGQSIEAIGQMGLPQPDIAIPKVFESVCISALFIH